MLAAIVPAAFENVSEADQVRIDIGVRIDQRVAHAGLRREMHDMGEPMLGKQGRHAGAVGEIEPDEAEAGKLCEFGEPRVFQRRIVIGVEIVDADDGAAAFQQTPADVIADETGGAGDKYGIYSRHRSISFGFCARSSFDFTSMTTPCPPLSNPPINGQPPET